MGGFVVKKGSREYAARLPARLGRQTLSLNPNVPYTKEEMARFLQENVRFLGWSFAGEGQIELAFSPVEDPRALLYLERQAEGSEAFFQLLRHRTAVRKAGSGRSSADPVLLLAPEETVAYPVEGATEGLELTTTSYIERNVEEGNFSPSDIGEAAYYGFPEGCKSYDAVKKGTWSAVKLWRTNEGFHWTDESYPSSLPYKTLALEEAKEGKILLPWVPFLKSAGMSLPYRKRTAEEEGSRDLRGQKGMRYVVWAPELLVKGSPGSWFSLESYAALPSRAYFSYVDDLPVG